MRINRLSAPALVALLVAAACGGGGETKKPSLDVDPPESVKGNVALLPIEVSGLDIVKADGDTSGTSGHFHVFIDRDPVGAGTIIPKEKGIVHSADNPIKLYGMAVGRHRVTVVVGDGVHKRILPGLEQKFTVAIEGPSVQASAPAVAKPGEQVALDLKVEGLTLAPADGDTSGKTGHLHVLVDREPPAGQPIPKEPGIIHTTETSVKLPPMPAGEHAVWVVAGDGNHVPLQPPVMAKLTVMVQ